MRQRLSLCDLALLNEMVPPVHQKKAQLRDHGFTDYFKAHSELDENMYHQVLKCRILKLLKKCKAEMVPFTPCHFLCLFDRLL